MVGRDRAGSGAFETLAVDERADLVAGAEVEDKPAGAAREPAQDGRDRGRRHIRRASRHIGYRHGRPPPRDVLFCLADRRDHPFIGFLRGLAEGEDAVLEEDQPFYRGRIGMDRGASPGEPEARHDVGHEPHRAAIDLAADRLAIRLVGQREDRIGMRMVDEFQRQERVQEGFHRRVGRARVEQVETLKIHHVFVAEPVESGEPAKRFEPHRGEAGRFDSGHVPAAALDAEHVRHIAQQVGHRRLDRGVAAAVQHEARIAAQKPRGVDPKRDILGDPVGRVSGDRGSGVARRIEALHAYPAAARRRSG